MPTDPAGVTDAVAAYRRAGWLSAFGRTDAEAAAHVGQALAGEWGWPLRVGLDEALLRADGERTWADDVECDLTEGAGVYCQVVAELCRLLGSPPPPGGVEEDWDREPGTVVVTIRGPGPVQVLRVPAAGEFLHPAVVEEVNRIFHGLRARLWFVDTGGQAAVVTRATAEERAVLQAARPVRLDETPPEWWAALVSQQPPPVPGPSRTEAVAARWEALLSAHGPPRPGRQPSARYQVELPPVPGILSLYGNCPAADGEAYLGWVEAVAGRRAAALAELLAAVGAPVRATGTDPDGLEDLGGFIMQWLPEVAAPLYGRDWSYDFADVAAFVRAHASDGTLAPSIREGRPGAEAYLAVRGAGVVTGLCLMYPSRRSTLAPLLESLAHDLGFLVAERARRQRPEVRWQLSRRRIGPGRSAAPEGLPVLEPEAQPEALSALWTFPPIPAQTLLYKALSHPDGPAWEPEQRWLLWDSYQMIVTGRPSGRSAGHR